MATNIVLVEQPKRPLSAYNYFFRSERAQLLGVELTEKDPSEKRKHRKVHGKIGFKDMASQIGARWKSLTDEERAPFTAQFQEDRARYRAEMKVWNARLNNREKQAKSKKPTKQPKKAKKEAVPEAATSSGHSDAKPVKKEEAKATEVFSVNDTIDISLQILENDFKSGRNSTSSGGRKRTHTDLVNNEALNYHLSTFLQEQQEKLSDTGMPHVCLSTDIPTLDSEGDFENFLKDFDFSDDFVPIISEKPKASVPKKQKNVVPAQVTSSNLSQQQIEQSRFMAAQLKQFQSTLPASLGGKVVPSFKQATSNEVRPVVKVPKVTAPVMKTVDKPWWGSAMSGYEPPSSTTCSSSYRFNLKMVEQQTPKDLMQSIQSLQLSMRSLDCDFDVSCTEERAAVPTGRSLMATKDFWSSTISLIDPFESPCQAMAA